MAKEKQLRLVITGDSRQAERALESVSAKSHKLGAALKVGLAAAGAAAAGFVAAMKSSVDAAAEEERAVAMLSQAMQQHGTYSAAALEDLKKFASEQQRLTTFGDDATLAAMHQLQTFGMNTEQMKAATKAAQDLAAAKGMDLTTAANLVGRAFAGNTAMMSRYGIVLDDARLQAEGFSYVLEALNQQFGGAAEAAADTYLGRMEQMKNAWGDLQETIGYAVLPALTEVGKSLTGVFQGLQESGALESILTPLADAFGMLAPLVGDAVASIAEIFASSDLLPAISSVFASIFEALTPLIQQLGPPIAQILAQLANIAAQVLSGLAPVIQALAPILANIAQQVGAFLERAAPVLGEIAGMLGDIVSRILTAIGPHLDRILNAVFAIIEAVLPILPTLLSLAQPILDLLLQLIPPLTTIVEWAAKLAEVIVGALGTALEWVVGAIQNFSGVWSAVWDGVRSAFEGVWSAVQWVYDNVIVKIAEALKAVWNGLDAAWDAVWSAAKEIVRGAANAIISVINGLIKGMNTVSGVVDWLIPGVEWGDIPEIPMLAQGGIITRPTIAMLGERGPEAVIPLRSAAAPVAGGDIHVHFHIPGFFGSQRELDDLARRLMADHLPRVSFARGAA